MLKERENLPGITKPLIVLYFTQGTCYLAYSLWRVFSRIVFFRAPPGLVFLYEVYLIFVFVASLYFLYTSLLLFSDRRPVKKSDLVNSSLSTILWILPAILSFGNANTYLTNPNIPTDIKAQWVQYLWTGIFFTAIGIMNMASILYIIYYLTKRRK